MHHTINTQNNFELFVFLVTTDQISAEETKNFSTRGAFYMR